MSTRKFHQASPEEKQIYKKNSFANIRNFKRIMDEEKIEFWITCGLLLGLHRDGDMIKNDEDDIDINIWKKDFNKFRDVIYRLDEIGFTVGSRRRGFDHNISSLALRRNDCQIDVKFMDIKNDKAFILMDMNYDVTEDKRRVPTKPKSYKAFIFPKEIFEKFGVIRWHHLYLRCPKNIEEYLILRYGEDWRTPKYQFETWTDWRNPADNPCLDLHFTL